tara:strand:- start:3360 stop:3614 length:255 start_codon:yes stop_codon:yes gene_type:complete
MSTLGTFILLGHFCWTVPNTIDSCKQILIKDAISFADCSVKFQSRVSREEDKIVKKGASLTAAEAYCYEVDSVDSFVKLSYSIK